MTNATYGRMTFGRCVDRDYGYVGCSRDVLPIADRWCSGRQSCEIPVPNSEFRSTQPCPKDLKPYFQAVHTCVPVQTGPAISCDKAGITKVRAKSGYLAKAVAVDAKFGTADCPWLIEVPRGQRVNVTLLDFSQAAWESSNLVAHDAGVCRVTAVIREKGAGKRGHTVCGGEHRQRVVYTSTSSAIEVRILGVSDTDRGYFLLKYDATGCPDLPAPQGATVTRQGLVSEVTCHDGVKYRLECEGNTWKGSPAANCSDDNASPFVPKLGEVVLGSLLMPFEVSIAVIVAIALAIGIIILFLGLMCRYSRWRLTAHARQKRDLSKPPLPQNGNTYDEKMMIRPMSASEESFPPPPLYDTGSKGSSEFIENEYAYIDELPPPPPPLPPLPPAKPEERRMRAGSVQHSPYEHVVVNGYQRYGNQSKLLAHECALAATRGNCLPPTPSPRSQRPRARSRLPSDSSESGIGPTYYELDPELDGYDTNFYPTIDLYRLHQQQQQQQQQQQELQQQQQLQHQFSQHHQPVNDFAYKAFEPERRSSRGQNTL